MGDDSNAAGPMPGRVRRAARLGVTGLAAGVVIGCLFGGWPTPRPGLAVTGDAIAAPPTAGASPAAGLGSQSASDRQPSDGGAAPNPTSVGAGPVAPPAAANATPGPSGLPPLGPATSGAAGAGSAGGSAPAAPSDPVSPHGPTVSPSRPVIVVRPVTAYPVTVHVLATHDHMADDAGVGVTIGGVARQLCAGGGSTCSYSARAGEQILFTAPAGRIVDFLSSAPCLGATSLVTRCSFPASAPVSVVLKILTPPALTRVH